MHFKTLLFTASAALVAAQDPVALTAALSSTPELSQLNTILEGFPDREFSCILDVAAANP